MLKNVTLLAAERDGKATWRLLGPNGLPLASFTAFADSLLRRHPFNTRATYCRGLAEFFDYIIEASAALAVEAQAKKAHTPLLHEVVEAYHDYLVLGGTSGNRIATLVASSKPSPKHSPATAAVMHAPVRKLLSMSEQLRREIEELATLGLNGNAPKKLTRLPKIQEMKAVSPMQRSSMQATSMIAGVISGGPKFLRSLNVSQKSKRIESGDSRAFPFDRIADFIDSLPTARDRALYAFIAASGCRIHEALQLLFEDLELRAEQVYLRNPWGRINHPSYIALAPRDRDRLAWKGRETEMTLLIEPFASMFFKNLSDYINSEYVPHGLHEFIFQFMTIRQRGKPFFTSAPSSRLETFKKAAAAVGVDDLVRGPHSLRHAYGTYLLNYFPRPNGDYGLPVAAVQQLMGHASPKSTLKYARYDRDLLLFELKHANAMIFRGESPKSIVELKLEALNAQIKRLLADGAGQSNESLKNA